jgi:amino acid transporter
MAHGGSDLEASYSERNNNDLFPSINSSSKNNDLFPSINSSNVKYPTIHSDEESVDISEHSSVRQFRNIFNKQKILNRSAESVLERNLFQLHFDTTSDIELSTLSSKRDISLDASIIGKILISEAQENDDRFQYLKAYENLKKQRGGNFEEDASVFDLSLMDDYNKYIKQTEINEVIHQGVMEKHKDNVLSIIKSRDLAENFYHDNKSDDLKRIKSKKKSRIPWYRIDKKITRKESSTESLFDGDDTIPPSNKKQSKYLQRKLKIRHLQMISFGGTLGVGLFLNSGKAFVLAGGFGTLLAFTICGLIVLATMVSFCEMVTFVSVIDGVSGLSSRFVDESFGFAVGWLYFASFAFGLAGEILASVMMLSYYPNLKITHHEGSIAGFVTLFLSLIVISNLVDVRIFGEIEYISSLIKIICVLIMMVIMIVLNTGGFGSEKIGFKYWQRLKSDFEHNIIFGLFRPSFNLKDNGSTSSRLAIGGDKGRFLSLLTALLVTAYAYSGTEIVCIAACEAKNPRKALPSATRRVFWRIIILYCLSIFLVSLNIYAGDPRLLRYLLGNTSISGDEHEINEYTMKYVGGFNCNSDSTVFGGFGSGSQSPWIVALQSANLCKFSSVSNALLTFFAVSCGNAQLYVSSRTIYSLALQKKAPKVLTYCNNYGIPYNAVLFSACFGLFAYLCVSEKATIVFQDLTSIISSSGIIAWFAMCLSFIRFYYGLKLRPDIISRNDKAYPYKSPFQPYSAILGLVGSGLIILAMGYVVFLDGEWDTLFFFSSYGSLMVFVILYFGHRLVTGSRTRSLETLDYDSGRREMDRYVWDAGREFNLRSFKEVAQRIISFLA